MPRAVLNRNHFLTGQIFQIAGYKIYRVIAGENRSAGGSYLVSLAPGLL
jgi:hypothetical protein